MSGFRSGKLTDAQRARRNGLPVVQQLDETALDQSRLVVLDLETSGLNTQRDQVLSIGAVVIQGGSIDLGSQYECILYRADQRLSESILIHGLAPSELAQGMEPAEALLAFMEFADQCVFLAFHAPFDQRMLARALRHELGVRLQHAFIDVAEWAPMLYPEAEVGRGGLDDWAAFFKLSNSQRHHASADALTTAEIALILLSRGRMQGILTLADLHSRLADWRRLQRSRSNGI